MLKVKDHSYMLSAQYLVKCLEEDHVCHGITTQEPRPRPMKESLHSRHHSTVLPILNQHGKPPEYAHTRGRFGYSVLKERPPPISDEETEPKTTMHSLTTTVRTLPSIAGLQA